MVTIHEGMQRDGYKFNAETLQRVAFRTLEIKGSVFLRADAAAVDSFVGKLAERRKVQPRGSGKQYKCIAVMDSGDRIRIEAYRQELIKSMPEGALESFDWDKTVDATQAPPFGKAQDFLPTIIKNSHMYNFKAERFFLPQELLCAQGIPMASDDARYKQGIPAPLLTLCELFPEKSMSMIGNSMHLCQVGTAFGIALMNAF